MKFADILTEYGIPYRTEGQHTRAGWLQFNCPFCRGGRDPGKPYAGYSHQTGIVNCWRCGPHRAGDTLAALTGLPVGRMLALLGPHRAGPAAPVMARGKYRPPPHGPLGAAHRAYLRGRGFCPKTLIQLWGIGGIGIASRLAWRIFIPIHHNGIPVSYTTRAIADIEPRYISAAPADEAYPHKELLYGADYARHGVVVVEGPTGVWRLGPGTVATLGTGYTPAQARALTAHPVIGICFDPEPAAQARARALCDGLAALGCRVSNIVLDSGDPGTARPRDVRRVRRHFLND